MIISPELTDPNFFDYYKDTGCKESPSCLDCPLPMCIHDSPIPMRKAIRHEKDLEKVRDFEEALQSMGRLAAARFVAKLHGITERTFHRILQRVQLATSE